jgi:1-acyl-sn-glycerol-3-phosphate acyltransferase
VEHAARLIPAGVDCCLPVFPLHVKSTSTGRMEDRFGVRLAQCSNRLFSRIYHDVKVFAPSRLPRKGPAIVVCNHASGLDPMLIQAACGRMIVWMMASEYYKIQSLRWFYEAIEAIPVDRRGRDMAATRAALRTLANGRVLGVFPEGRIETERRLLPFQTGAAMMAIKTGVDVYPAYLDGTQRGKEMVPAIVGSNNVRLSFGPPIPFTKGHASKEVLEQATARIRNAVSELKRQFEPGFQHGEPT